MIISVRVSQDWAPMLDRFEFFLCRESPFSHYSQVVVCDYRWTKGYGPAPWFPGPAGG